jgi:hypothetical protein
LAQGDFDFVDTVVPGTSSKRRERNIGTLLFRSVRPDILSFFINHTISFLPINSRVTAPLNSNQSNNYTTSVPTTKLPLTNIITMSGSIEYLNVDPNVARDHFQQNFDLNRPDQAMSSYQKQMHQHTKQQFECATASSRRRSSGPVASFQHDDSRGSVSSDDSMNSTSS